MTHERSDALFKASRDAEIKFDYFMLGVVGALCAFVGQSFAPSRLGFNPGTLELLSLLLFVASAVAGFRRIESINQLMQMNIQYLRMNEEKGELTSALGKHGFNRNTGEFYSPDDIAKKIAIRNELIPSVHSEMERIKSNISRTYKIRNYLLLIGFLTLLASRVWSAYVQN